VVREAFDDAHVRLVHGIRSSGTLRWELVGVDDAGDVVGHVIVSDMTIVETGETICQLSPLGVRPSHQRRGLGGSLVRAVCELAEEAGEPVVVLEGSPDYYPRFGFEPATPLGIVLPLPDWAPPEAGQARRLRAWATSPVRGTVQYTPPFDEFD